ncbi:hypothetical protein [Aquimarina pacifica]|uniref:hypothetical protein n=1 Tax=Aquimarina pacifica TaxID=1296415 RepID=UPI0004724273|nr:hypothetical protein [Aquimarina pacifica]
MKKLFYVLPIVSALFLFSCEREDSTDFIDEDAQLETDINSVQVAPKQVEVARVQKNGHEFKFLEVGTEGNILVVHKLNEFADQNDPVAMLLDDTERTPFDIFLGITDASIAVPASIAKTAAMGALEQSKRATGNTGASLELLEPNFGSVQKASCYDVGAAVFANTYCYAPVVSTPTNIEFCDSGLWNTNIRNSVFGGSWRYLDDTTTWTNVVCGLTRMQFYGNSVLEAQVDLNNGIWKINYYTGTNKKRQVKRYRPQNTGSFRAFTRFF